MNARRLSGIQPSGQLHLGNFFGAIRQHVEQQDNAFYFLANYHAQTTIADADELRQNTVEAAAAYLALGLNPSRATLFRQSDVPEVVELAWLLSTATSKGLLDRAVSYKDKVAQGITPGLALYIYPVLMAADIVAYETDIVPVGGDQVQHVEMCRDMAQSFNNRYKKEVFKVPRYEIGTSVPVPGVDGQKMSKSYGNAIPIFAEGKALRERVMGIVTDSTPVDVPKDPEKCTVFQLFRLVAPEPDVVEMKSKYRSGGYGYGHAKTDLLNVLLEFFHGARQRYQEFLSHPDKIEDVLRAGSSTARPVAQSVLDRARAASGV